MTESFRLRCRADQARDTAFYSEAAWRSKTEAPPRRTGGSPPVLRGRPNPREALIMATHPDRLLQHLRALVPGPSATQASDAELLDDFLSGNERAFADLVARHGPM